MIFILLMLVLVAGVTFFMAIQGAYSALLTAILTLLSAAIAVNYYAPLSQAMLMAAIPDYADAVSLGGLFLITLIVLRVIADSLIRGNIVMYPWPDRLVAGMISLPTALLLVGLSSISMQMLPFGQSLLLFDRFGIEGTERKSVFPYADDFAAGFISFLSKGSLSGPSEFGKLHPDWPGEVSAQRIAVQAESRHAVPSGGVKVIKAWPLEQPLRIMKFSIIGRYRYNVKITRSEEGTRPPKGGYQYLAVQLQVQSSAADPDEYHRFAWGQVRLVGVSDSISRTEVDLYAVGFGDLDEVGKYNYIRETVPVLPESKEETNEVNIDNPDLRNYGLVSRKQGLGEFEVVFEVPDGFQPMFVEYKRWGRAPMPKPVEPEPTADKAQTPANPTPPLRDEGRGWHTQFEVDYSRSGFTPKLPFGLTSKDGRLQTGETISGWIGRNRPGDLDQQGTPVREFDVPPGKVLFRLECRFDPAQTSLLQNIFGAVGRVAQRYISDTRGNKYMPAGIYGMIARNEGTEVELQYDPELGEYKAGRQNLSHIALSRQGANDVKIGFLFLVEPGVQLDSFEMGGPPFKPQDLRQYTAQ